MKSLIGITPNGVVSFCSDLYCGSKFNISGSTKTDNLSLLKLVLPGNLLMLHWISLDYFYHHQCFVYTRQIKN